MPDDNQLGTRLPSLTTINLSPSHHHINDSDGVTFHHHSSDSDGTLFLFPLFLFGIH
jgi:hypothetical protein